MRPSLLSLALLLLVGLAVGVLFWFQVDTSPTELSSTTDALAEDDGVGVHREESEGLARGERKTAEIATPISTPIIEPEETILVRCLNKETREPLAKMQVCHWLRGDLPPSGMGNMVVSAADMMRFPRQFSADDQGEVRIVVPGKKFSVGAYSAEYVGRKDLYDLPTEGVVVVEAIPRRFVTARVVGARGEPVSQAVVRLVHKMQSPARSYDMVLHQEFVTESDGLVRIPLQALDQFVAGARTAFLRLDGLYDPHIEVEFDAINLPTEPLILQMPKSGSVVVSVVSSAGEEPEEEEIWFTVADALVRQNQIHQTHYRTLRRGPIEFLPLALGRRFVLRVEPIGSSSYAKRNIEFDGPKTPGEIVQVTVDLSEGPRRSFIVGRLVDPQSIPLANERAIRMELQADKGGSLIRTMDTDEEGRFSMRLDAYAKEWQEVQIDLSTRMDDMRPGLAAGRCQRNKNSIFDFGDLKLMPLPLLAQGRVVNDQGQPVSDARISVAKPRSIPAMPNYTLDGVTATEYQGDFALYGQEVADPVALSVSAKGFLKSNFEVARGSSANVLRLSRASWIKAKFLTEDPDLLKQLQLRLIAGDDQSREYLGVALPTSGELLYETRPRSVVLELRHPSNQAALWESKLLNLVAGETMDLGEITVKSPGKRVVLHFEYPALGEEDLGAHFYRHADKGSLELLDSAGQPEALLGRLQALQPQASVFLQALPARLKISMAGMRSKIIDVDREELTVSMKRGLEVVLRLEGLPTLPERVQLWLTLLPDVNEKSPSTIKTELKSDQKQLSFVLGSVGPMKISAELRRLTKNGNFEHLDVSDLFFPQVIQVHDRESSQELSVQLAGPKLRERALTW